MKGYRSTLAIVFSLTALAQPCWAQTFDDLEVAAGRDGQPTAHRFAGAHWEIKATTPPKVVTSAAFPVVTADMSIGPVGPTEGAALHHQILSRPFFIIGYDTTSIRWLKSNRATLIEQQAIGLVVNVANQKQMEALQELAGTRIPLHPTPGDRLAKHFGIKHYPFFSIETGRSDERAGG